MTVKKLSRAEELAIQAEKDSLAFLEDKESAQSLRAQNIANLKALRLEKEAKERKAQKKFANIVNKNKE